MATKIFLNNVWQDYDYEYLYNNLGVTTIKSKNIVAYDSSMNEIRGWYNSGYIWIIKDNQWYSENTTPYYVFTETSICLYLIDNQEVFPIYIENGSTYVIKDGSFLKPSFLHDNYGYTNTPSVVWEVDDQDVPISWYNLEENLYWDNINKIWSIDPPRQLPTVSILKSSNNNEWGYLNSSLSNSSVSFSKGALLDVYYEPNTPMLIDGSCVYAVCECQSPEGTTYSYSPSYGPKEVQRLLSFVENVSTHSLQCRNTSGYNLSFTRMKIYYCNNITVTLETVYKYIYPYNYYYLAFKFIYNNNNIVYYYVIDGVNTEWVEDIDSTGYHLPKFAYFTQQGSSATSNSYYNSHGDTTIYDENGSPIVYDTSKTYIIVRIVLYNGTDNSTGGLYLVNRNGILTFNNSNYGSSQGYRIFYIEM